MNKKKEIKVNNNQQFIILLMDLILSLFILLLMNTFFHFNDYVYTIAISFAWAFLIYSLWGVAKLKKIESSKPVPYSSEYTNGEITPYVGNKPYIFISYSHNDAERVDPILQLLMDNGYRFWFDTEIPLGEDWEDYIQEKIEQSVVFMPFLSEHSEKSHDCKVEQNYAHKLEKNIIPMVLDQGISKMYFDVHNALNITNDTDPNEIIDRLNRTPILEECRQF